MAAILAGTGLVLSGAAPAAGRQVAQASLEYTCHAPAGWQPIPAQVTVGIPETATAGQPIRPTTAAITVTLPRADGEHLAELNASKVSLTAQISGEAAGNGTSVADPWLLKTVSAPVPTHGDLVLQVPGAVQPVTERAAGDVTFTAVGLSLLLSPQITDGTTASPAPSTTASPAPSTTDSSAPLRLSCALNPGQTGTLATIPVAATSGPAATATRPASGHFLNGLWEAQPGGSISGTGKPAVLKDVTTGTAIDCTSSSVSGTFKTGQQLSPVGIGSFSSVTMLTCVGPGGKTFKVTTSASPSHPWLLSAQSYDLTSTVTSLTISGIMAGVSGPGCSASMAGTNPTAPGTVKGTSVSIFVAGIAQETLTVSPSGGSLHVWNVSGCSGLFNDGDALTFSVGYAVTPAQWMALNFCPPFPVNKGFPFNKHFKFPKPPHGSTTTNPKPPTQSCAFIKGFTNVQKLNGAALVGPGFGNIQKARQISTNIKHHVYIQLDSAGKLYYKPCPGGAPRCKAISGLPPLHATFLSFGFVPTTATLQITQVGTLNIVVVSQGVTLILAQIQSLASIRVEKVLVNGAPLNVGRECHTVKPFVLELNGKPPYNLDDGGVLSGTVNVPPFTGCGVGENLDPIFNATVSGPGNLAQITQGNLCSNWPVLTSPPVGCPATVPKPIH